MPVKHLLSLRTIRCQTAAVHYVFIADVKSCVMWHAASIIIVTGVCLTLSRRSCQTDGDMCRAAGRRWKVRRRVTVEGRCWSRCSWKQPSKSVPWKLEDFETIIYSNIRSSKYSSQTQPRAKVVLNGCLFILQSAWDNVLSGRHWTVIKSIQIIHFYSSSF